MKHPTFLFRPQQSFQHTMREIAVNRQDPCELIRELISNAVDATASQILIMPYWEKKGIIFFDNGNGLSQNEKDVKDGVVPYTAFYSIGKSTKQRGSSIGYKGQGSKLCFASKRVTVVTRCKGESCWRLKVVDDPKNTLNESYDITPRTTNTPWKDLQNEIFVNGDHRTAKLMQYVDKRFFEKSFTQGTLLVIEAFETQEYDKIVSTGNRSYLWNYIRFFTAHGDVRLITKPQGFDASDIAVFESYRKGKPSPPELRVLEEPTGGPCSFQTIVSGYPYLPVTADDRKSSSPSECSRLRDGRFSARFADTIEHEKQIYHLILAVDGRRRTLDGYSELGRQGDKACGITLATQRGTFLSAFGVKIASFNEIFDNSILAEYEALKDGVDNYVFFIDGPFDLVTNRNGVAPNSAQMLADSAFIEKIKTFLDDCQSRKTGVILKELLDTLSRERTHAREEQYRKAMEQLRENLDDRAAFFVEIDGVDELSDKVFYEPATGEEHFVGALYTLFSHLVKADHPLIKYWNRPLTFRAFGIDAIASLDDEKRTHEYLEYKYHFTPDVEFNHPLTVAERIVCWDFDDSVKGKTISDAFGYTGSITALIEVDEKVIGCVVDKISKRGGSRALGSSIEVISLRRLLRAIFNVTPRPAGRSGTHGKGKRPGRKPKMTAARRGVRPKKKKS